MGDRVLVANKSERGKRKLADKWEDGVYTVVDANHGIHVYKIQDAAGQTKVVHRNLLLEVNFLPLPGKDQCGDAQATALSLESQESDQEDCDSGDETAPVCGLLAQGSGTQNQTHFSEEQGSATLSLDVSEASGPVDIEEEIQPIQVPSSDTDIIDCSSTSLVPHSAASVVLGTQGHTVGDSGVRTRAGRLVKSVNRLLESIC